MSFFNRAPKAQAVAARHVSAQELEQTKRVCRQTIASASAKGQDVNATRLERSCALGIIPPDMVDYAAQQGVELIYEV